MLQMRAAVRGLQFILVSARVQAKHGPMIAFLKAAASSAAGGRCRWFADAENDRKMFQSRAARRAAGHQIEMVTLVTEFERASFGQSWPRVQTLWELRQSIHEIDRARSVIGPCGR